MSMISLDCFLCAVSAFGLLYVSPPLCPTKSSRGPPCAFQDLVEQIPVVPQIPVTEEMTEGMTEDKKSEDRECNTLQIPYKYYTLLNLL